MVKGLDYYDVLGLTRDADNLAIRRAFRKLALHFHPEINKDESAAQEFNRMCEAYDVLSNPRRKGFYDLYGEDALKDGVPEGQGLKGSLYHFDPELTPEQVFSRFFGTANPYEALDAISSQFEAMTVAEQPMVGRNKVYTVELSLEEIFHGCLKKVSHKRKILHDNGEYTEELRFLTIDVKPGLPSGTRFLFEREGNITPKKQPGPVVFILKPLQHNLFQRRGADLVRRVTLPLYQALCGAAVEIPTLDNRILSVPIADIVKPGFRTIIVGEGMPKPGGGKGDLILEVDLLFPMELTEQQKLLLKSAFFLPTQPSEKQNAALLEFEKAFKHPLEGWSKKLPKNILES